VSLAASFLGGARSRLLPPSIPFRFFGAAIVFHVAAWLALVMAADEVPGFSGGLGMPLAALHLLTLGVLAATAIGAAFQLLPVATRQPLTAVWPTRLAFWLFVPGVLAMGHGMGAIHLPVLAAGGGLVSAGLVVFALITAGNLRRAKDLRLVAAHGWVAVAALAAMLALGLMLVADFHAALLPDHGAAALAHLILAGYGFMGMLALGFSHILVPMFVLSPAPPTWLGRTQLLLSILGLVLGVVGALAGNTPLLAAAGLSGLAAAAAYLGAMAVALKTRMRKRLDLSFAFMAVAWLMLPVSLILGLGTLFGRAGGNGPALFGFVLVVGWLLTFLLGVLQRIMPFLASMHASKRGGKPPLVSELMSGLPLRVLAACHFPALALVAAGIALDHGATVRAGAVLGTAGALAFAWFGAIVIRRMTATPRAAPKPGAAGPAGG